MLNHAFSWELTDCYGASTAEIQSHPQFSLLKKKSLLHSLSSLDYCRAAAVQVAENVVLVQK